MQIIRRNAKDGTLTRSSVELKQRSKSTERVSMLTDKGFDDLSGDSDTEMTVEVPRNSKSGTTLSEALAKLPDKTIKRDGETLVLRRYKDGSSQLCAVKTKDEPPRVDLSRVNAALDEAHANKELRFQTLKDVWRVEKGEIKPETVYRNLTRRIGAEQQGSRPTM